MAVEIFLTILVNVAMVVYIATMLWLISYIDRRIHAVREELRRLESAIRQVERVAGR